MKKVVSWRVLALFGLAVLGLVLRLYGLNWDQGNNFHPDERQILFRVMTLSWPTSVTQFFDPVNSPLNPHFFAYGSFPLYLLASLGNILSHFSPNIATMTGLTLLGRVLSAVFDSGTILLTGWLGLLLAGEKAGERRQGWAVGLLAAALVTFIPLQLQLSHFYVVDTLLLFFVVLTVLACVALVDTDKPVRWAVVVGLAYALAVATKFSATPLAVPLLVAVAMRWYKHGAYTALIPLLLIACMAWITFLIVMPYALLDLPNFVQQLSQQSDLARGLLDLPYVRQFAGTTPYVYEIQNIVLWGMGVTLGIAAFAGLLWLLWRVWKRDAGLWLIVLAWVLVYAGITGDFYVKFMRYMLPIYPFLTLMAATLLVAGVRLAQTKQEQGYVKKILAALPYLAILLVLGGTMFQGLALLNVYSQPNTRIQASQWIYSHIAPGSVLTYEQWDDPLPVAIGNSFPGMYAQASYPAANGQPQTGLDLYGDDTTDKAHQLANLLPTINVITMASDRLDKSIPRLPFRYPLTNHYYQLLFSGQLGFHQAQRFEVRPNLFGITLNDSDADESYSVFDHPTVKIFVRDTPYPYTSAQLFNKLLAGIQLPPLGARLSGIQHSLLLTPQQIADNQASPPFSEQFPANSVSNIQPVFFWWITLLLLGWLVYPITALALHSLRDRGYIFSKLLGILLLTYFAWLLASLHLLAFNLLSLWLVIGGLFVCSCALYTWQRRTLHAFLRQHWRLILLEEGLFTLALLLFVGIRALNPDLWHIYHGGEKPMELAFLNAVLRSSYMPPYDPWFAGGYINYYYYGYVMFGALIKLTGIIPTTAFNLAIPTLFALTFTGVCSLVYSLTRRYSIALLAGYFVALIGNLDGLVQLKGQLLALLAHGPISAFDYWQSSRVIPFTINEFPFWSFLFADLHPHVIDLPVAVLMLGIATALLLPERKEITSGERRGGMTLLYLLAAFIFGTIACINPWDVPAYALVLGGTLLLRTYQEKRGSKRFEVLVSSGLCLMSIVLLCGLGYFFYLPFYKFYQQLYVDGVGAVGQGTSWSDFLTVFGLWIFLALSFLLLELYRWWVVRSETKIEPRRLAGYFLLCGVVLTFVVLLGLKMLLAVLIALAVFLFVMWSRVSIGTHVMRPFSAPAAPTNTNAIAAFDATSRFTYLLLVLGLCILLGQELIYVRDFLDGGAYYRMNTVFKFSMQAWLCLGISGALAVQRLWQTLSGIVKRMWGVCLVVLVVACSIFLPAGTASRIGEHEGWAKFYGSPPVQSANYTPTLDGFAFVRAWYPADAQAITWLNDHVAGSPVILEAVAPDASYQWFNRVSVYTGLPDVLGWPDHVSEQRYDDQSLNRITDINTIYTTSDVGLALELLHYYHVRYIYVGPLEQQLYRLQAANGLSKFDDMIGQFVHVAYHANGVIIYEMT